MAILKRLILLLALFGVQAAFADQSIIRLSSFPSMSVADARSTVTVTAVVHKQNGNPVPDGTPVAFTTTLGSFREPVVQVSGGRARAILVAGGVPGTATIVASCPGAPPSQLEVEFLSDRSLLSSAKEYVEIVAPGFMQFSVDQSVIEAAGPGKGVHLRYREIEIEADDLQLKIPTYEIRARRAKLHLGKMTQEFDQLYLRLNTRRGYGYTRFISPQIKSFRAAGHGFTVETVDQMHYGLAEITSTELRNPRVQPYQDQFEFEDVTTSASMVAAKKAVVFPRKEVQFQKAEILVGGVKIMKLPLYSVNLQTTTPIITDNIFQVSDNQVEINYPHYLSLKPGQTSLLRFHTGDRYGRSLTGSRGLFLDYEMNWNRGDEMEGGVTVGNLARSDWMIGAHQYLRLDDRTTASGFLEMPAARSLFGSASISRQLDGFVANFFANSNRSLKGQPYNSSQVSFAVDQNPVKVPNLPVRVSFGLSADQSTAQSESISRSQSSVGLRMRSQFLPWRLDSTSTINASFDVSHLEGHNVNQGLTLSGMATLAKQFGNNASALLTYNFTQDPFSSSLLGRHRLSLTASFSKGPFDFNFQGSRSLDVERMSYFVDMSYRFSDTWRLSYAYTYDHYFSDSFLDYSVILGYRLGYREIGLTWSQRTKRIGIQLLGAGIN